MTAADALVQNLVNMGMPAVRHGAADGLLHQSDELGQRRRAAGAINFATNLTQGKLAGAQFDPAGLLTLDILKSRDLSEARAALAQGHTGLDFATAIIEGAILQGDLPAQDEALIRNELQDPEVKRQTAQTPSDALRFAAGYTLASPAFQHH